MKKVYDSLPVFLQNLACTVKGILEKKSRFGGDFNEILSELKKTEWYSKEDISKYQNEKLQWMVAYCYENVPYYRELFDTIKLKPTDINSLEDLNKIPILTKEDVRKNYKKLMNPNFKGKTSTTHTSGSTGKSLEFLFSQDAIQYRWALWSRHKARFNINVDDKYATFTGLPAVPLNQKKPPYWRENYAMKQTIFTMHHINEKTVFSIVKKLNKDNFAYYSGYPSILFSLATIIEDLNLKIVNSPKIIFTGAETLLENQRERIAKVFGCPVTDQYGFSEGCGNASRCKEDVFHEDFEYGILECNNPKKNADDSYTGSVLATGFTNLAMPFIRYEVGDTATWKDQRCKCGRESKIITSVNGRNEDFVLTPEGNKILRFDYVFKDTKSIIESQIIQEKLGEIIMKIVPRKEYDKNKTEAFLKKQVKEKISNTLIVKFDYVNQIEKEETGKYRAVKSYLK
jgi:phenylacetate-CoA ligase